jgi:hypothetical protein
MLVAQVGMIATHRISLQVPQIIHPLHLKWYLLPGMGRNQVAIWHLLMEKRDKMAVVDGGIHGWLIGDLCGMSDVGKSPFGLLRKAKLLCPFVNFCDSKKSAAFLYVYSYVYPDFRDKLW